jgi:hypothetical protein
VIEPAISYQSDKGVNEIEAQEWVEQVSEVEAHEVIEESEPIKDRQSTNISIPKSTKKVRIVNIRSDERSRHIMTNYMTHIITR